MQKINTSRILLNVALLGTFAVAPLLTPSAQAKPPKHAPAHGYRNKKDKNKKNDRRDDRNRDRDDRDRDYRDRDRDDRDRDDRDRDRDDRNDATFVGTVVNVRGGNSFDLRANGRTYNVYTSSSLPRGLNRGDEVRVYGRLFGDNDIRNASVSITDNNNYDPRRDDRNDDNSDYRNYNGVVTNIKSSREFDVRIDGRIYNVYADSSTSGLDRDDEVRIYGRPYGDNDIRNASVRITRNR